MKIGHPDHQPASTPNVGSSPVGEAGVKAARQGHAPAQPAAAAPSSTTVALSPAIAEAAAHAVDGSFDAEKVERIASAIAQGRFKINPEAIADKLISNALELLGKASR